MNPSPSQWVCGWAEERVVAAVVSLRVGVGWGRATRVGQRPVGIKKTKKKLLQAAWTLTTATPPCRRSCCAISLPLGEHGGRESGVGFKRCQVHAVYLCIVQKRIQTPCRVYTQYKGDPMAEQWRELWGWAVNWNSFFRAKRSIYPRMVFQGSGWCTRLEQTFGASSRGAVPDAIKFL